MGKLVLGRALNQQSTVHTSGTKWDIMTCPASQRVSQASTFSSK